MIGKVNTGGGGGSYAVTMTGVAGATVTYSGPSAGSVVLSSAGTGGVSGLKRGNYVFTDSISEWSVAREISDNASVSLIPDGAVYWYGTYPMLAGAFDTSYNAYYASQAIARSTPTITCGSQSVTLGNGSTKLSTAAFLNPVTLAGYSKLEIRASSVTAGTDCFLCLIQDKTTGSQYYTRLAYQKLVTAGIVTCDFTIPEGITQGWVGIGMYAAGVTAQAIWLE